jgi:K+-sensing histidine kinase KdpD
LSSKGSWIRRVHIDLGRVADRLPRRKYCMQNLNLARELGAEVISGARYRCRHWVNAETCAQTEECVTQILIGKSPQTFWQKITGSVDARPAHGVFCGDLEVHVYGDNVSGKKALAPTSFRGVESDLKSPHQYLRGGCSATGFADDSRDLHSA